MFFLLVVATSSIVTAGAQNLAITPKSNVVVPLDPGGGFTLTPGTLATVSGTNATTKITITPATLNCADVGTKNVTIRAVNTKADPSAVSFGNVIGLVSDPAGNLALSDLNFSFLKYITASGTVSTIGTPGTPYSGKGLPNYAFPGAMAIDKAGNIYYASNNGNEHNIYKITPSGILTFIVSEYNTNFGTIDGPLETATFSDIGGIAVDDAGNLYATQTTRGVRKITPDGMVTTIAGSNNGYSGFLDGKGSAALFSYPEGIAVDGSGNLFVVDYDNFAIRKITPDGTVSTFAGGTYGHLDGTGKNAKFELMDGITIDNQGNLFVTDGGTYIRKITPAAVVTTLAGSASPGLTNGPVSQATFNGAYALATDGQGNIYVDDRGNDVIRKITPGGDVSTYAGSGQQGYNNGQIITETGTPVSATVPVTVKGSLTITSTYQNITIPVSTNCPTLFADYTKTAAATDNCSNLVTYSQVPAPGSPVSGNAPISVTITAKDDIGQQFTVSFNVTPDHQAVPPPSIIISTAQTTFCAGSLIEFTAVPVNAGTQFSYQWLLNGNPVGSNQPAYSAVSFKNNDVVACNLTVLDGCSQTVQSNTVTLKVNDNLTPEVQITVTGQNTCQGSPVTFTANTVNAGANPGYQWQVNGINTGDNSPTFVSATLKDGDQVHCTLTNNDPSCLTVKSVTSADVAVSITALQSPSVTISANTQDPVCPGAMLTFTATTRNTATPAYQWLVNGKNAGSDQNTFSVSDLVHGDQVSCIITGGAACLVFPSATSNVINANVLPAQAPPVVTINTDNGPACTGVPVTFTALVSIPVPALTYQWLINGTDSGTTGSTFSSKALKDGDQVSCVVSSDPSCLAPVTSNILTVRIYPLPRISFAGSQQIKQGEHVLLRPIVSGDVATYQWTPATGLSSAIAVNPVANPARTTTYQLTVTSETGCQDTASITVTVLTTLLIPNAFTPNGDGINDLWEIPSLSYYSNARVSIFNRYGSLLFRSTGYARPWDGTYNGKSVPGGTYYYLIDLKNGTPPYSGYVVLIR